MKTIRQNAYDQIFRRVKSTRQAIIKHYNNIELRAFWESQYKLAMKKRIKMLQWEIKRGVL